MEYTIEQILERVADLNPIEGLAQSNGNRLNLVRTHVYESVLVDGNPLPLKRDESGRYRAIYLRVSTQSAAEEGFSTPEQATVLVNQAIEKQEAFAVFSDSGLSGGLPYDDKELIQDIRDQKARMYDEVFSAVFLSNPEAETPENLTRLKDYLAKHKHEIKTGGQRDDEEMIRRGRERVRVDFRPGLTALVQSLENIHTISVTDLSRFSRSELLMADLLPRIHKLAIRMEGKYQDLNYLCDRSLSSKLMGTIYIHMADHTRFDVLIGSLRGIRQRLVSGQHHSNPPGWIKYDKDSDEWVYDEAAANLRRRMVEIYLDDNEDDEEKSVTHVMHILNAEGKQSTKGKYFGSNTVRANLDNPALFGYQEVFGKFWRIPLFKPIIDEDTYWRVQKKRKRRAGHYKRLTENAIHTDHLMSGLIKCWCGFLCCAKQQQNGVWYLQCQATIDRPNDGTGKWHVKLREDTVDNFFHALLKQHSTGVFEIIAKNSNGTALIDELRELEERALMSASARRETLRKRQEETAHEITDNMKIPPDDPDFSSLLTTLLKRNTRDLTAQEQEEQERIASVRSRLKDIRHEEELKKTQAIIKQWGELTTRQQNRVLKDLFTHLQFGGEKPYEFLMPFLKLPKQPEWIVPIDIAYNPKGLGMRRMTHPVTWLANMYAAENREEDAALALAEAEGDEEGLRATVERGEWDGEE